MINYCSLSCYRDRRHGKCSEQFYRECCERSARDCNVSPECREQIMRMAQLEDQKQEYECAQQEDCDENSEDSDDSSDDISKRLNDIDLTSSEFDFETVWSRLTKEEKREFHRQLANGTIYSSIPLWTPWWHPSAKDLVTSFPDDCIESASRPALRAVKPLSKLLSSAPHPSVVYALAEVLLGFTLTARYFNGEYLQDMYFESADFLLKLVSCLTAPQMPQSEINRTERTHIVREASVTAPIFTNFKEVLAFFQSRLAENRLACSSSTIVLSTDDLHRLLGTVGLAQRALSEVEELLEKAASKKSKSKVLQFALRKVTFLQACMREQDASAKKWLREVLPRLQREVEASLCSQAMRVEMENKTRNHSRPVRPSVLPDWRNIIRSKMPQKPIFEYTSPPV
ncbi:unnamed protein product [Schistocephalus solidus]|uniref:BPTI/Kunitz inhibitor domain-containing protein n=1 Tax=Schistocephalus solidus TaxID=70667 RepID=A0A183TNG0_SCHSO|nr:unnamed protein product [Schistocephalus solidus]